MFLYSGRGYWQELIESILWAHHKLKILPHIQPRALSISQGRAVGFIHYFLSRWSWLYMGILYFKDGCAFVVGEAISWFNR